MGHSYVYGSSPYPVYAREHSIPRSLPRSSVGEAGFEYLANNIDPSLAGPRSPLQAAGAHAIRFPEDHPGAPLFAHTQMLSIQSAAQGGVTPLPSASQARLGSPYSHLDYSSGSSSGLSPPGESEYHFDNPSTPPDMVPMRHFPPPAYLEHPWDFAGLDLSLPLDSGVNPADISPSQDALLDVFDGDGKAFDLQDYRLFDLGSQSSSYETELHLSPDLGGLERPSSPDEVHVRDEIHVSDRLAQASCYPSPLDDDDDSFPEEDNSASFKAEDGDGDGDYKPGESTNGPAQGLLRADGTRKAASATPPHDPAAAIRLPRGRGPVPEPPPPRLPPRRLPVATSRCRSAPRRWRAPSAAAAAAVPGAAAPV